MNNKEKFELAVNPGLQAIPYVGGPLENYGLITATLHSISLGGPNSGMPMMLNASEF